MFLWWINILSSLLIDVTKDLIKIYVLQFIWLLDINRLNTLQKAEVKGSVWQCHFLKRKLSMTIMFC